MLNYECSLPGLKLRRDRTEVTCTMGHLAMTTRLHRSNFSDGHKRLERYPATTQIIVLPPLESRQSTAHKAVVTIAADVTTVGFLFASWNHTNGGIADFVISDAERVQGRHYSTVTVFFTNQTSYSCFDKLLTCQSIAPPTL